jgi:crotonobetainyl-CoA:carnitine CoA-transferase CaiB-like acyl-CoA transferase
MTEVRTRSGPCSAITVLELGTSMVSGPMCGQILGDLGADVIKLESLTGELMRGVPPIRGEFSGQFLQFNRNKRSLAVDLKSPQGVEIAAAAIARTDVLIENFRPGVATRLGLDYAQLSAANPRLIYASINGFGREGPYAKLPAYDQVIQGIAGFMPIQGGGDPAAVRSVIVDKVTALSAAASILAALLERSTTGLGRHVEVKMLDVFAAFIMPEFLAAHTFVAGPPQPLPPSSIYRTLRTADGHVVGLIAQDSQFVGICRALGRPELITDARFSTAAQRFRQMDELLAALEEATCRMSTQELLKMLWANGEIAIGPVNSLDDFLKDPQVLHNRTVFTLDDPECGPIRMLSPLVTCGQPPVDEFVRAPKVGEHTEVILGELGFSGASIEGLRAGGAVK